jgi:hypothetical protein
LRPNLHPATVPRGYPRPGPGAIEQAANVVFDHARQLAARGMAGGRAFLGEVNKTFGEPGLEIPVRQFAPGTVTPGAVFARLGTAIFSAARARANAAQRQEQQRAAMDYQSAKAEKLRADIGAVEDFDTGLKDAQGNPIIVKRTTPGQRLSFLKPTGTGQRPITLRKGVLGYPAGSQVTSAELSASGREATIAASRDIAGAYVGVRQAAAKRAKAEVLRKDMLSSGPTSTSIMSEGERLASHYAAVLRLGDNRHPEYAAARDSLGLPGNYKFDVWRPETGKLLTQAAGDFAKRYWAAGYQRHVAKLMPQFEALKAGGAGEEADIDATEEELTGAEEE